MKTGFCGSNFLSNKSFFNELTLICLYPLSGYGSIDTLRHNGTNGGFPSCFKVRFLAGC